jgi:hypothetical protein
MIFATSVSTPNTGPHASLELAIVIIEIRQPNSKLFPKKRDVKPPFLTAAGWPRIVAEFARGIC